MDLPGISVREIPSVVGDRYFFEVFLSDVRVPVAYRLGPEHAGWGVVTWSLAYERVGAARYARAAYTLDELAKLAAERAVSELALEMFGSESLEHGHFAESHFRLAMTAGVAVGTTEINLNLVASRFLSLPRE